MNHENFKKVYIIIYMKEFSLNRPFILTNQPQPTNNPFSKYEHLLYIQSKL